MKGTFKGFYNVGNDFPCNYWIEKTKKFAENEGSYTVIHLGSNPAYGIVFDNAYIIDVEESFEDNVSLEKNALFSVETTMEHDALIIIGSKQSIDSLYEGFLKLFNSFEQMSKKSRIPRYSWRG